MVKERNTFGMISYWFRAGQLGLSDKKRKYQDTLWWKRKNNASNRKAFEEIEKAF